MTSGERRLLILAAHLETRVRDEAFDMGSWRDCAVGHGCRNEALQAEGLTLYEYMGRHYPRFRGFDGWDAVRAFFDLDALDVSWLFDPTSYENRTPTAVAERIRVFTNSRTQERVCKATAVA